MIHRSTWVWLELHLSEHHGDATPGARVRVLVNDIEALHAELTSKNYNYARPGIGGPGNSSLAIHSKTS